MDAILDFILKLILLSLGLAVVGVIWVGIVAGAIDIHDYLQKRWRH